jgi:hypothetical protein
LLSQLRHSFILFVSSLFFNFNLFQSLLICCWTDKVVVFFLFWKMDRTSACLTNELVDQTDPPIQSSSDKRAGLSGRKPISERFSVRSDLLNRQSAQCLSGIIISRFIVLLSAGALRALYSRLQKFDCIRTLANKLVVQTDPHILTTGMQWSLSYFGHIQPQGCELLPRARQFGGDSRDARAALRMVRFLFQASIFPS